jgi:2-aminoadipate transaminase
MKLAAAAAREETRYQFAPRMSRIRVSAVREILKVTEQPEVISFAGGLPAPELFPVEAIGSALSEVLAREGGSALQYSTTEGWKPLREWISQRMRDAGIDASSDRVLITSGSQQGIDLVAKVFLDAGDAVVVENPCYLAALQTFGGFEASFITVGSDGQGMRVDQVERALREKNPKLIYVVSNFHNPKGTTLSGTRREQLIELSRRYRVPIVEDDPYGELRYTGSAPPLLASMDNEGLVIYLSTFSKTLSPGLRIGWVAASEPIVRALTIAKQASDLHTSTLLQRAIARMLSSFDYEAHLHRIRATYGERCQAMLGALRAHFPEGATWTRPEGGLFLWVELPRRIRAEDLLEDAIAARVAFVPGAPFFARNPQHHYLRLNFSHRPAEVIDEGIRRLAEALKGRIERLQ